MSILRLRLGARALSSFKSSYDNMRCSGSVRLPTRVMESNPTQTLQKQSAAVDTRGRSRESNG